MPITVEKTLYHFDELSDDAKETARDWFRSCRDVWSWLEEWWQSAQAFCDIAPVTLQSADYDRGHVDARFDEIAEIAELSGVRAWKWLTNNGAYTKINGKCVFMSWFELAKENAKGSCTLTGYCGDCPLFDPIAKLADSPSRVPDLESLFLECLQDWVFAARSDYESAYEDQQIDENIIANEYTFNAEGERDE